MRHPAMPEGFIEEIAAQLQVFDCPERLLPRENCLRRRQETVLLRPLKLVFVLVRVVAQVVADRDVEQEILAVEPDRGPDPWRFEIDVPPVVLKVIAIPVPDDGVPPGTGMGPDGVTRPDLVLVSAVPPSLVHGSTLNSSKSIPLELASNSPILATASPTCRTTRSKAAIGVNPTRPSSARAATVSELVR